MQNWKDLYKELCLKIGGNLDEVEWIDLWHNQVNFLETEHPFPTPAVFLAFRSNAINDHSERVQNVDLQMDCYLYYETFADTYNDSANQDSALGFLDTLNDLFALLHASDGENYSSMRRTGFNPEDTGGAGNLYRITFECTLTDYAAQKAWEDGEFEDIVASPGAPPDIEEDYTFEIPE